MNSLENKIIDSLIDLSENHGAVGIKAEFEAEGTSLEEAIHLKEMVSNSGLDFTIKVGGCESVKELYEARTIGVSNVVAPMIESPFALSKFSKAANVVFGDRRSRSVGLFINIETITAFHCLDELLLSDSVDNIDGIVIGRGDMAESLGLIRADVDKSQIFDITSQILLKASKKSLKFGLGGGISVESLAFMEKLPVPLDFFETRKVIFNYEKALTFNAREGIQKAVDFELMWLKFKQECCYPGHKEGIERIRILEARSQKAGV